MYLPPIVFLPPGGLSNHDSKYLAFYSLNPTSLATCFTLQQLYADQSKYSIDVALYRKKW